MAGTVECVIDEPVTVTTTGAATITAGVFAATLPVSSVVDVDIRFRESGCLVWNHRAAAPAAGNPANSAVPVEIVRLEVPAGAQAGGSVRIWNPCVRHTTDGVAGGQATNRIQGIAVVGAGASSIAVAVDRFDRVTVAGARESVPLSAVLTPNSPAGLAGGLMTPATIDYLARAKSFEGLDPTISWARYWIDPYSGSDANDGSYDRPFKTFAAWKARATFGTWFTVKNGGRATPMYFSQQTFPYSTTSGTCQVGEQISHNTTHDSRILDIDYRNQIIVVESLTATRLASATAFTGDRSGCSWTTGTRAPSLFDSAASGLGSGLCSDSGLVQCDIANRFTQSVCASGSICGAPSEAGIQLSATPTRYAGRIVSIFDAEDPTNPPVLHADGRTIGDLDGPSITGSANDDRNGVFVAKGATSYGCLGVANIRVVAVYDDVISQHGEGCVRALNVYADRVLNGGTTATNDNVVTTHGGTLGRGGIVSINGGGVGFKSSTSGGAPIAPTAVGGGTGLRSHMILVGSNPYVTDLTNWAGGAAKGSIVGGSGGDLTIVGHDLTCRNIAGGATGCDGFVYSNADSTATINVARSVIRGLTDGHASISVSTAGFPISIRGYRLSFGTGWAAYLNPANGAISVDVRGSIFDGLNANQYYLWEQVAGTTGNFFGVYDDDTTTRWRAVGGGTHATAAAMDAASAIDIMSANSLQTDATEYTSDRRCSTSGQCFDRYTETNVIPFPVPVYDYLPEPIYGWIERGTRNYGAR